MVDERNKVDEPDKDGPKKEPKNETLADVIRGLQAELEKLQANLDNQRLLQHPNREQILRDLVREIDAKQDRLEDLQALQRAGES